MPGPLDNIPSPNFQLASDNTPQQGSKQPLLGVSDILNNISNIPQTTPDVLAPAKETSFGAEQGNMERYTSDPGFDKLGYSPFRDNETLYNQNTSAWSDLARAAKQMPTMMGAGFMTAIKSYGDILTGQPFKPDTGTAETQEKATKIGGSSRDGLGGFLTNNFLQFGSILGLMGEMATEQAVLAGVTAFSDGGLSEFTLPKMVESIGSGIKNIAQVGDKINDTINILKDYNSADKFWQGAKTIGKNFLNPLRNTTKYYEDLNTARNMDILNPGGDALVQLAKNTSAPGAFYRDLREANFALSMAKVAGGSTKIDMTNQLIDEFSSTHNGQKPEKADLDKINDITDQAAYTTVAGALTAIYFGNRLVFDTLFTKLTPKSIFSGNLIDGLNVDTSETIPKFTLKAEGLEGLKQDLTSKDFYTKHGLKYLANGLTFTTMGAAQDVVSEATRNYYKDIYDNQPITWSNAIGNAIAGQFSSKGLDNLLSSFTQAGAIDIFGHILGNISKTSTDAIQKFKDPQQFNINKEKELQYKTDLAKTLNDIASDVMALFDPRIINNGTQQAAMSGMQSAEQIRSDKDFYDNKRVSIWSNIMTSLQTNTFDLFKKQLSDIKNMTPKAIEDAYNRSGNKINGEQTLSNIDKMLETADHIKSAWDAANITYGKNPIDMSLVKKYLDKEKTQINPEYNNLALIHKAFETSKLQAVLFKDTYTSNLERMSDIYNKVSTGSLKDIDGIDIQNITSQPLIKSEGTSLKESISALSGLDDKDSNELRIQLQKRQSALKELNEGLNEFKESDGKIEKSFGKAYDQYIRLLAKEKGINIFDKDIENSFNDIKDIHLLDGDNKKAIIAINMLSNPTGFKKHFESMVSVLGNIQEEQKEKTSKAYETPITKPAEPKPTSPVPVVGENVPGKTPSSLLVQLRTAFEKSGIYDSTKPENKEQQYKAWIRTDTGQAIIDKYNKDQEELKKTNISEKSKQAILNSVGDTINQEEANKPLGKESIVKTNLSELKSTQSHKDRHTTLVNALSNKEVVKGILEPQDPNALTKHTININGVSIDFYNHSTDKPINQDNKEVYLELNKELKVGDKIFHNVVEVYQGSNKIGDVRESDKFEPKVPKFKDGDFIRDKSGDIYQVDNDKAKLVLKSGLSVEETKNFAPISLTKDNLSKFTKYEPSKPTVISTIEPEPNQKEIETITDKNMKETLSTKEDILKSIRDRVIKTGEDNSINDMLDNSGCK